MAAFSLAVQQLNQPSNVWKFIHRPVILYRRRSFRNLAQFGAVVGEVRIWKNGDFQGFCWVEIYTHTHTNCHRYSW